MVQQLRVPSSSSSPSSHKRPASFPTEILCFIFAYLQHYRADLAVCARVCHQWFLPSMLQLYKSPWFCTKRVTESFARTVHQAHSKTEANPGETAPFGIRVNELVRIINLEHEACQKYLWDEDQVLLVLQACKNITHLRLGGLGRRPIWYSPSQRIFDLAVQRQNLRVIQYNDNCEVASTGMRRVLFLIANLPNLSKLSVYGEIQDVANDEYFVTRMAVDEPDLWNPSEAVPEFPNEHTALDSISFKTEWFDERFVVALLRHLPNLTRVRFGSLVHQPSFLGVKSIQSLVANCKKVKSLKLVFTELVQPDLPEIARLVAITYGGQLEKFRLVVDGLVENALELFEEALEFGHIDGPIATGAILAGQWAGTMVPFSFGENFENLENGVAWSNGFLEQHIETPAGTLDMENAFAQLWDAIGGKLNCLYLGGSWFTPSIIRSLTLSLAKVNNPSVDGPIECAASCPSYKGPLRHLYLYAPDHQPRDVAQFDAESERLISLVGSDLRKLVLDGTRNFFGNNVGAAIASSCRSLLTLTLISASMNSDMIIHVLKNAGTQLDQLVLMSDSSLTPEVAKSIPTSCPRLGSLNWIRTPDMVYRRFEEPTRLSPGEMCDEEVLLDILKHLGPKRLRAFLFSDYPVTPRLLQGVQRYAKSLEELWLKLPEDDLQVGANDTYDHGDSDPRTSTNTAVDVTESSDSTIPSFPPTTLLTSSSSSSSANPSAISVTPEEDSRSTVPDPHTQSYSVSSPEKYVSQPSYSSLSDLSVSSLTDLMGELAVQERRELLAEKEREREKGSNEEDGLWNGKLMELETARRKVMESCRYLDVFYL